MMIKFTTMYECIDKTECTSPPLLALTITDRAPYPSAYVIKYEFEDETGEPVRLKCDATEIIPKGNNYPGLARYAVIDERRADVKFCL